MKPDENSLRDIKVIGELPARDAILKLRELDENELAAELESHSATVQLDSMISPLELLGLKSRPWQHTAYSYGYVAPMQELGAPQTIFSAGDFVGDASLKGRRINISLGQFRVVDYPGRGVHHILVDFYAQNYVGRNVEHLHINTFCDVAEGERAAVLNRRLFTGLRVGETGVSFRCLTVNIKSSADEGLIGFLKDDLFKSGLTLISRVQPAIGPLAKMSVGLAEAMAKRSRNVAVQKFELGLDFSRVPFGARLAEGAYIAVQIPELARSVWEWKDWVYSARSGTIYRREDSVTLIPYNYLVFNVTRFDQ